MRRRPFRARESAGHPFRRSPPIVAAVADVPVVTPYDDDHDVKLFLLSFAAFFVCFYTFIM